MEQEIAYAPSAFKHGIAGADIEYAIKTHITDELVMYNHIDEAAIKVFHAMKCRRHFRDKFGI
jgi:hypothetical protein